MIPQVPRLAAAAGLALAAIGAHAAELPTAEPAGVDLSAERLERLDEKLAALMEAGQYPGFVMLVARKGEIVHFTAEGRMRPGGPKMTKDAIFRIYSMTKPITSVAAMMLVEAGELKLSDPVSAHLPAFKDMQVATGEGETEPAKRPITVQDLMRHTSGLTYGFFGEGAARDAYKKTEVGSKALDNMAQAKLLAGLPLEHQPGTAWEYSRSTDVLGAVIEAVSGRSLGDFLDRRIFTPLEMTDTGFSVPEADHDRIAEPHEDDRKVGQFDVFDPRQDPAFESGGGGLVSTAQDYARFLQMLLNGGELDGARLLSQQTVNYMTADHLGDIPPGKYYLPGAGYGFGLGFAVRETDGVAPAAGSAGGYYWGGAAGTYFWVDPEADLFTVFMVQTPKNRAALRPILRNMVYAAFGAPESVGN